MKSITGEARFRQRLCEYALKNDVTKEQDDIRLIDSSYIVNLKNMMEMYEVLPHNEEELDLIRRMLRRKGIYGLAEVYVRCKDKGYTRSF